MADYNREKDEKEELPRIHDMAGDFCGTTLSFILSYAVCELHG